MDVTLLSYGSRGDVQPYLALARSLRHIGHHVRVVGPPNFASLAEAHGIAFFAVGMDLQAHLNERIKALPESGNVLRSLRAHARASGAARRLIQMEHGTARAIDHIHRALGTRSVA
jgi:UDP:flavonoid glycosyltransferase YjiC (YdhE family)